MAVIGNRATCRRAIALALCLQAAAFAEVVWSENFEGEARWQVRAAEGGHVTVSARPEGAGRCLHLKGPESGRHMVILPEAPLQAGHSYLLRWGEPGRRSLGCRRGTLWDQQGPPQGRWHGRFGNRSVDPARTPHFRFRWRY